MGTKFFRPQAPRVGAPPSELNMMARAINAPNYAERADAAGAQKDLGAAKALGSARVSPLKFMPGGK